ncbi:MAG: universal stress protein [Sulfitobacter sp.]|nr:universal stress protein [Sulfitobacter sp.]
MPNRTDQGQTTRTHSLRKLGRLKSTVLGSVAQKVLHHAQCNVVTVK